MASIFKEFNLKLFITPTNQELDGYDVFSPETHKENYLYFWKYTLQYQPTEIYAPTIIDALNVDFINEFIEKIADYIRPGGKVVLGGTDLYIACKHALSRNVDLYTINQILFNKPYQIASIGSISGTRKMLEDLGFSINNVEIDQANFMYTVEAIKQ